MHVVPVVSVPFTGKHFLSAFFGEFKLLKNHTEWETLSNGAGLGAWSLNPRVGSLVTGHVTEETFLTMAAVALWWRLIVPLRDPLAALISAKQRNPEVTHYQALKPWRMLVNRVAPLEPHYIALDLLNDKGARWQALYNLLYVTGLAGVPEATDVANKWGRLWPKYSHNSLGVYPLKTALLAGDASLIRSEMPLEWEALKATEGWLRPFLEARGYEGLLWWER